MAQTNLRRGRASVRKKPKLPDLQRIGAELPPHYLPAGGSRVMLDRHQHGAGVKTLSRTSKYPLCSSMSSTACFSTRSASSKT